MILFLDFDGTTHPEPSLSKEAFCQLPLVESVLREFPAVEIVISSAWRVGWKDERTAVVQLRKHFSDDLRARVVGVTPEHQNLDPEAAPEGLVAYRREWECVTWLRTHRDPWTRWLALDDRHWWFRPFCPNLMVVDGYEGFVETDTAEFRRRLSALGERT